MPDGCTLFKQWTYQLATPFVLPSTAVYRAPRLACLHVPAALVITHTDSNNVDMTKTQRHEGQKTKTILKDQSYVVFDEACSLSSEWALWVEALGAQTYQPTAGYYVFP